MLSYCAVVGSPAKTDISSAWNVEEGLRADASANSSALELWKQSKEVTQNATSQDLILHAQQPQDTQVERTLPHIQGLFQGFPPLLPSQSQLPIPATFSTDSFFSQKAAELQKALADSEAARRHLSERLDRLEDEAQKGAQRYAPTPPQGALTGGQPAPDCLQPPFSQGGWSPDGTPMVGESTPGVHQGKHNPNLKLFIPSAGLKKLEEEYTARAVVGLVFGNRPPLEIMKSWVRQHWGPLGIEVAQAQALPNNYYLFLLKTPEMALKALGAGQWMVRNSPLCLFRWSPQFSAEGNAHSLYPVWVELPHLPLQYQPFIKRLVEPLGKVLGTRPVQEFNPRWHPQVLVEMDLNGPFPPQVEIYRDDGVCLNQALIYKHLPKACFHCGLQGHAIKECPSRFPYRPQAPAPQPLKPDPPRQAEKEKQEEFTQVTGKGRRNGGAKRQPQKKGNRFALLESLPESEVAESAESSAQAQAASAASPNLDLNRLEEEVTSLDAVTLAIDKGKGKINEDETVATNPASPMETQKDLKRSHDQVAKSPARTPQPQRKPNKSRK